MEGTGHRLSRTLPALYPPSMTIRQLSPETVNRIAAGEVIERPASVVKELVENALDAGASEIEVVTAAGGLSLIRVTDDGARHGRRPTWRWPSSGTPPPSSPTRTCSTSRTLGFRGEALPSIGSIARICRSQSRPARGRRGARDRRRSRRQEARCGRPRVNPGTCVEVRELFSATPARLKFLKSERAENMADLRGGEAPRHGPPACRLHADHGRARRPQAAARAAARAGRPLASGSGASWAASSSTTRCRSTSSARACGVTGFAGLPTLHRPDAGQQFLFVNGRPVKDKLLIGAVRAAYGDLIPKGRYPLLALFVDVSPARGRRQRASGKAEVRFRDGGRVRALLIGGAAAGAGGRGPPRVDARRHGDARCVPCRDDPGRCRAGAGDAAPPADRHGRAVLHAIDVRLSSDTAGFRVARLGGSDAGAARRLSTSRAPMRAPPRRRCRMRSARPPARRSARAAARDLHRGADAHSMVIVDQHAAHERLVYERMKAALADGGVGAPGAADPGDRRARR